MVVTSGRSNRHVAAIADQLVRALREGGETKPRIEGLPHGDWVLVDASDVIVHIFRPEVREFYNIEKMWAVDFAADAP
jgi:ribosome-associated protein